jgi:hypothetical protein
VAGYNRISSLLSVVNCSRGSCICCSWAYGPNLELRGPTGISLLSLLDLPFPNWTFPSPGYVALLMAGDTIVGCAFVLLSAVLRTMASCATKAAPRYTTVVLSYVVVLVAFEALSDVATTIE